MPETLARSSLGSLRPGAPVNLELAMRASDRLGGHIVQGHVDGTGTVAAVTAEGISRVVEIDADPELVRYLVEKGSVAVDGVSLTVSALRDDGFAVSLIPETLARPRSAALGAGDAVNIEVDVLAKHVERLARHGRSRRRSAAHEHADRVPASRRSSRRSRTPRRARWSSSATTRTARTRAT